MTTSYPPPMPHHDLQPIVDDAWYLQGSASLKPLVRLQRNMVVLRHEGQLTLINAIRLNPEGEAALEALGTVAHIVKIGGHGMDDAYYLDRYGAQHWAIPGVAEDLGAQVLGGVEMPHPGLSLFLFTSTNQPEGALLLGSQLLITCDSIQHWEPSDLMSLPAKLLTKVMGFQQPAQIGPAWRKVMTPAGGSLRPDFERLLEHPFEHLIGGHGGLCRGDAHAQLRNTLTRVYGP